MQPDGSYGSQQQLPPQPGQSFSPGQYPQITPQQNQNPGQLPPLQPQIPGQPLPTYQAPNVTMPKPLQPDMPPPPAAPETPYDFFMQPKPSPGLNPLPESGKRLGGVALPKPVNKTTRLLIAAVGGGLLLVLLLVAIVAFLPKNQTAPQFFGIAQTQQELIRVCTDGASKAKYRSTRNFAITCSTGVTNSQQQLLAYMGNAKLAYDAELLGSKTNSQTTTALAAATSSSTYDETFHDIMSDYLTAYERELTTLLGTTTGINGRDVLSKNQASAELLSQMIADDSDKTIVTEEE